MISEDIRVVDIDARHWINLIGLFGEPLRPGAKRSLALILTKDGRAVKAVHSRRGLVPGYRLPEKGGLEQARKELGASRVIAAEADLLPRILHAWQSAIDLDDDYARQIMESIRAVLPEIRGGVRFHPPLPFRVRLPSTRTAQRLLDWGFPDGRTLVLGVFEQGGIHTSLILGKDDGDLDLLSTFDALDLSGLDLADWRGCCEKILQRTAQRFAKPWTGIFMERRTFLEMRAGARPLRFLLEARARGTAVVRPLPLRISLALRVLSRFGVA